MRVVGAFGAILSSLALAAFDSSDYPTQWQGSYFCGQGVTDATLTLRGDPGGPATALFEFYPHATNTAMPSGSFAMRGFIAEDADEHSGPTVTLVGERWIERPEGWIMLNISGRFQSNGEAFVGDVTSQDGNPNACTAIALVRTAMGSEVR